MIDVEHSAASSSLRELCEYLVGTLIVDTRIQPSELNVPENAMTIASFLHAAFGRFDFSFDAVVSLSRTLLCIYTNAS
jgi:HNH endonuclease